MPEHRSALAALLLLHAGAAMAQAPAVQDELVWICWVNSRPDFVIRCRLNDDALLADMRPVAAGSSGDLAHQLPAATPPPVDNAGIRLALFRPGSSPNVARLVRQDPVQYADLVWTIPLFGLPLDDGRVRELAQSVMCGSGSDCVAYFGAPTLPVRLATR